jgi:hypothetical protein
MKSATNSTGVAFSVLAQVAAIPLLAVIRHRSGIGRRE